MAVIKGRERYSPSARFVTYLFAIARRRTMDRWRQRGRHFEEDAIIPRSPIKDLVIRIDGEAGQAATEFYGQPNADHGVSGTIPEPFANKLFDALDLGTPFTLDLTYASGARETVRARTWGSGAFNHNHRSDAPVRRCLRSLVPASKQGLEHRLVELEHPQ
jgi:hypothetical protein